MKLAAVIVTLGLAGLCLLEPVSASTCTKTGSGKSLKTSTKRKGYKIISINDWTFPSRLGPAGCTGYPTIKACANDRLRFTNIAPGIPHGVAIYTGKDAFMANGKPSCPSSGYKQLVAPGTTLNSKHAFTSKPLKSYVGKRVKNGQSILVFCQVSGHCTAGMYFKVTLFNCKNSRG